MPKACFILGQALKLQHATWAKEGCHELAFKWLAFHGGVQPVPDDALHFGAGF